MSAQADETLRTLVAQHGWRVAAESEIPFGRQLRVTDGTHTVPVSVFSTGTVLVQGAPSPLRSALEAGLRSSRRGRRPRGQPAPAPESTHATVEWQESWAWTERHLTRAVYAFLPRHGRAAYLSGAGLLLATQRAGLPLADPSVVVLPFTRAYESFLLAFTARVRHAQPGAAPLGGDSLGVALQRLRAALTATGDAEAAGVVGTLLDAWRIRNRAVHAGPAPPRTRQSVAERDIDRLNQAMRRGHRYLARRGLGGPDEAQRARGSPRPERQVPVTPRRRGGA